MLSVPFRVSTVTTLPSFQHRLPLGSRMARTNCATVTHRRALPRFAAFTTPKNKPRWQSVHACLGFLSGRQARRRAGTRAAVLPVSPACQNAQPERAETRANALDAVALPHYAKQKHVLLRFVASQRQSEKARSKESLDSIAFTSTIPNTPNQRSLKC